MGKGKIDLGLGGIGLGRGVGGRRRARVLLANENTLTYDNYYKYITKERPQTSQREK